MATPCPTCRRPTPNNTVCGDCLNNVTSQLTLIPTLLHRLVTESLIPGGAANDDSITRISYASRPPAAVDTLDLIAAPAEAILRAITHPAPAANASIPIWVHGWAAYWRHTWDHHPPEGVRRQAWNPHQPYPWLVPHPMTDSDRSEASRRTGAWARLVLAVDGRHKTSDAASADEINSFSQQDQRRGDADVTPSRDADHHDPVAAHILTRFGAAQPTHRLQTDLTYLNTWSEPTLTSPHHDPRPFTTGLAGLISAARAALGEHTEQIYLGRCPEVLTDQHGRDRYVEISGPPGTQPTMELARCGARLTRDPQADLVVCPGCRRETPERGLLALAGAMKRAWGETAGRDAWR